MCLGLAGMCMFVDLSITKEATRKFFSKYQEIFYVNIF
jgi:hypothetical protein